MGGVEGLGAAIITHHPEDKHMARGLRQPISNGYLVTAHTILVWKNINQRDVTGKLA